MLFKLNNYVKVERNILFLKIEKRKNCKEIFIFIYIKISYLLERNLSYKYMLYVKYLLQFQTHN